MRTRLEVFTVVLGLLGCGGDEAGSGERALEASAEALSAGSGVLRNKRASVLWSGSGRARRRAHRWRTAGMRVRAVRSLPPARGPAAGHVRRSQSPRGRTGCPTLVRQPRATRAAARRAGLLRRVRYTTPLGLQGRRAPRSESGIIAVSQSTFLPAPENGVYDVWVAYDPSYNVAPFVEYEGLAEVEFAPKIEPVKRLLPDLSFRGTERVTFDTPSFPIFEPEPPAGSGCFLSEMERTAHRTAYASTKSSPTRAAARSTSSSRFRAASLPRTTPSCQVPAGIRDRRRLLATAGGRGRGSTASTTTITTRALRRRSSGARS